MPVQRPEIKPDQVQRAVNMLHLELMRRLKEKGWGSFTSVHEILGIVTEETSKELVDAVHANSLQDVKRELLDIAVACVFGVACIEQGVIES